MATFSLPRESIEESFGYPVLTSRFEGQTEQRRLKSTKKLIGFRITSPALTEAGMQTYRDFFTARSGEFETFTFVSPFDGISYTVHFVGEIKSTFSRGHFRCSFEFQVVS